jgi:hypothetical protein
MPYEYFYEISKSKQAEKTFKRIIKNEILYEIIRKI